MGNTNQSLTKVEVKGSGAGPLHYYRNSRLSENFLEDGEYKKGQPDKVHQISIVLNYPLGLQQTRAHIHPKAQANS